MPESSIDLTGYYHLVEGNFESTIKIYLFFYNLNSGIITQYDANNCFKDFINPISMVANTGNTNGSYTPHVLVAYLGDRYIKLLLHPGEQRLQDLALVFEGLAFGNMYP
jgi:hypothetical protein